jgi:hypothetical protein
MERLYHVTPEKNLPSISSRGLEPRIGPRAKEIGEEEPRIYLYRSRNEVWDGLNGWMMRAFECPVLALLEVEVSRGRVLATEMEWATRRPIQPSCISLVKRFEFRKESR